MTSIDDKGEQQAFVVVTDDEVDAKIASLHCWFSQAA